MWVHEARRRAGRLVRRSPFDRREQLPAREANQPSSRGREYERGVHEDDGPGEQANDLRRRGAGERDEGERRMPECYPVTVVDTRGYRNEATRRGGGRIGGDLAP